MKHYKILNVAGEAVAFIQANDVRWIERGVDFQPNIFNGYHAVEIGEGQGPAVLNLPEGMKIFELEYNEECSKGRSPSKIRRERAEAIAKQEKLSESGQREAPSCSDCGAVMVPHGSIWKCGNCGASSGCS